jgi:hypothetical protein
MEAAGSSEMMVLIYQATRRHIQDDYMRWRILVCAL